MAKEQNNQKKKYLFKNKIMVIITEAQYEQLKRYKSGADQITYKVEGEDYIVKKPKSGRFAPYQIAVYRMMEKYPQFFAKIYLIEPTEIKQELLDDKSFLRDFFRLFYAMDKIQNIKGSRLIDKMLELFLNIAYEDAETLKIAVNLDKNNFAFFNALRNWFRAFLSARYWGATDLHPQQMGYNKEGKIKIFDI